MKALSIFAICLLSASASFAERDLRPTMSKDPGQYDFTYIPVPVDEAAMAKAPADALSRLAVDPSPTKAATKKEKCKALLVTFLLLEDEKQLEKDYLKLGCGTRATFIRDSTLRSLSVPFLGLHRLGTVVVNSTRSGLERMHLIRPSGAMQTAQTKTTNRANASN